MELVLFREIIVFVAVAAAAYTDMKTGLIYDKITYPLIAIGLVLNLIEFDVSSYLLAAAVFMAGYAIYYTGRIGGGDVKLFTGITLVLPFLNGRFFLLDVIVVSAIIAVVFLSAYYVSRYAKDGIDFRENRQGIMRSLVIGIATLIYFIFILQSGIAEAGTVFALGIPIAFALVFLALEKGIRRKFFLHKISHEEVEEDELIAVDEMDNGMRGKLGLGIKGIADNEVMTKIRELELKDIPVYRNLPRFAPFALAGVVAAIFFGGILGSIVVW